MASFLYREHLRKRRLWLSAGMLFLAMLLLSMWWLGPAPPRRIILATGQAKGGHAYFASHYQEKLRRMGLKVDLLASNGSLENCELLLAGKADVAFVQGGTYPLVQDPDQVLRALAAVYLEPLWFFYRGKEPARNVAGFIHRTIAIGAPKSGTEAVCRLLLKENGIDESNSRFLHLTVAEASKQLKAGKVDVAFFVSSIHSPLILELLREKDIHLLSINRQEAYCGRFPYLSPVKLAEGILDLKENIPGHEVSLLAPAALLVCRQDLHPRAVEQILKAAQAIHGPASLVDNSRKFPSLKEVDLPVHPAAERYLHSGETLLTRLLPYRGVWLFYQVQVLILPILVVWIPFLKILPAVYLFRVNRLLRRHYIALRDLESALEQTDDPARARELLGKLDNLGKDIAWVSRKVPGHLQRDVYNWRLHVAMVRTDALDRIRRLEEKEAAVRQE